jgi:DeoR/GlpR family transcriptional regulator of sugar metabolism
MARGSDGAKIRRWEIASLAAKKGHVGLRDLLDTYGNEVTHQTIRNDLAAISALPRFARDPQTAGLVAQPNDLEAFLANTYFGRSLANEAKRATKEALADALVDRDAPLADREGRPLVDPEAGSVVVGPGSTALLVLQRLAALGQQMMTCNIGALIQPTAMTESMHLCGGWLHKDTGCLVGTEAVNSIARFIADTAIIGVSGLHWEQTEDGIRDVTLYCHHEVQRPVKEALIQRRRKVIAVTCCDAIGKTDAWPFAEVPRILEHSDFYLVTDDGLPEQMAEDLRRSFAAMKTPHVADLKVVQTQKD